MSSGVYYRSWMDKTHMDPNTNLLTEEYVQGIGEFMKLVEQQPDAKTGMLRCLCSTCNNPFTII
uniref:Transposase-associated domain-containing protein n=1 Tax=Brassica oleracea var. oleracea TaxID=109376 RepID=A0A0D3ALN1_BRAOL